MIGSRGMMVMGNEKISSSVLNEEAAITTSGISTTSSRIAASADAKPNL